MKQLLLALIACLVMACSVKKRSAEKETFSQDKKVVSADSSKTALEKNKTVASDSKTARNDTTHKTVDEDIDIDFTFAPGADPAKLILDKCDSSADSAFMEKLFKAGLGSPTGMHYHKKSKTTTDTHSQTTQQNNSQSVSSQKLSQSAGATKVSVEQNKGAKKIDTEEKRSAGGFSFTVILIIVAVIAAVYLVQRFSLITWFLNLFKAKQ